MDRPPIILNASSNLLGVALLIITGINISHFAKGSYADEIAWAAAVLFGASCILSYVSIRSADGRRTEALADKAFLGGSSALFVAVLVLALRPL